MDKNDLETNVIYIDGFLELNNYTDILRQFDACVSSKINHIDLFFGDAPGGRADPKLDELSERIHSARPQKRITAFVSRVCCSAPFQIASAASEIWAMEGSQVGAIGSIYDIDYSVPPASHSPRSPLPGDDEKLARFKAVIWEMIQYHDGTEKFINLVSKYRGVAIDQVRGWAQNKRTYWAADAFRLGMIDRLVKNF